MIYLLIALVSPFVLALLATIIDHFLNGSEISLQGLSATKEFPEFNFVTFFLFNLIVFGFGEEIGWRGFALTNRFKP